MHEYSAEHRIPRPPAPATPPQRPRVTARPKPQNAALRLSVMILAFWALAIFFQWASGSFRHELGGYPDEPSHYVTGLMVHDYVAAGAGSNPLTYALNYYRHYPRVGFGHWPPLFYMLEGAWMFAAGTSIGSALLLVSLLAALAATTFAAMLRPVLGWPVSIVLGMVFLLVPEMRVETAMVMLETGLVLVCTLALFQMVRFLRRGTLANAALCGFAIFAAIMTKGNGWFLVPAYGAALVLAGQWKLLFDRRTLVVGGIVALALPFQLMTLHTVSSALPGEFTALSAVRDFLGFLRVMPEQFGFLLLLLAAGQAAVLLGASISRRQWLRPLDAVMLASILAMLAFHSVASAGVEPRKLLVAVPAVLYFAAAGLLALLRQVPFTGHLTPRGLLPVALLLTAVASPAFWQLYRKPGYGFRAASLTAASSRANWLVSGSGLFEGAAIGELARQDHRPSRFVLRSTKLLADTSWNATEYRLRYHSPAEVEALLADLPVDWVALENGTPDPALAHHAILRKALDESPHSWIRVGATSGQGTGGVTIYRRAAPAMARKEADVLRFTSGPGTLR